MTTQYSLLYWSVPFRGQFVRAVLAFAGKDWTEIDDAAISEFMKGPVAEMAVPFMGPPVLIDNTNGFAISQMPAIILYLGETLNLMPSTPELRALTMKVVNDANDVIDELTLQGGRDMWTEDRWQKAIPRLRKWMTIWEELGKRNGLTEAGGDLLGEGRPGIADIVTSTLWTTVADRFSKIEALLAETAPHTLALSGRIASLPAMAALNEKTRREYGDAYAGGQIGASMASILN
ncbi:glutathione S-transferase [Oryzicola mucosus]|uniref:Glutathione S-transferase n=1 Tax=Oryzicola mucosus TaxID=2767425 RepID=A0A8J6PWP4_9HYPH|nr:glutathione S-transferase [Oryzicola mucosus]MBD0415628.1 glutathione S-transferase [Oryzicola mucosus]